MMYGAVMFPSRTLFHLYFSFTTSKEAWMDEVWWVEGEVVMWNLCFSRHFQDWEMGNV